jgi:hypothetical protein
MAVMLFSSVLVFGVSLLSGITLLALYQWGRPFGRVWWPGALHGLVGVAGFGLLLAGLQGPPQGLRSGAGSFGVIAAAFLAAALALGLAVAAGRLWRKRPSTLVLGVHATLAVTGLTLLAAYVSAP